MRAILFTFFFGWIIVVGGVLFADENEEPSAGIPRETKQSSFFTGNNTTVEKQIVELFRKKKLTSRTDYPKLRRLVAQKVAFDCRQQMRNEWGKDSDPIYTWLEKHPEFLENFLLALDTKHDNIPVALRIVKHLVTHYPKQVANYPDLTIAIAVVWDQPEVIDFGSISQFGATTPPDAASGEEIFLYYTDEKYPFKSRIQTLPWEVLLYVVWHKVSKEERQWAYTTYGHDIRMIGNKYHDVPWRHGDPPPLSGKPYTLSNMRQYGGVCTCQADFAVNLCRVLSVPAFYCGAGFPKYSGGHSWVMWLELKNITPNQFVFTFEQAGRYPDRKDYVASFCNPQTLQPENDGTVLHRFSRLGANILAARHSEILTQVYSLIAEREHLKFQEKLQLLQEINAVSPGTLFVWNEIASFGRNHQFTKKDVQTVLKLYKKLLSEFAATPNELPLLVSGLLSFPEIEDQRERLYSQLFAMLDAHKRPDLIFEAVQNLAHEELKNNNEAAALKNLAGAALKYYEEASRIEPILVLLEQTADKNPKANRDKIADFYSRFLALVLKKTDLPLDYRLDMLRRGEACFGKYDLSALQAGAKREILKLEQSQ